MLRPLSILDRFSQSLGACLRLLERPRVAGYTVVALLAVHTGLLAYSAYVHSPTLNEPGHLVAGLSHWKFGRFELYRVNPPLVRLVAALPVMAVGYEEDWSGFHDEPGTRPVFRMGIGLVRANGERSFFLFMIARWACIPFSWLGAIACYLWARDLNGRTSGVFACALWCFSPNILAHASLITADVGGTALGVAACYTFWQWLKKPTWTQAALTGIVLGLAELAKTTLILFYPLWPLLWVIYRWSDRHEMRVHDWTREAGMLVLRMAIGLYVLNLGYGFEGSDKQLGEFHFVSNLFTGNNEEAKPSSDSPAPSPQSLVPSHNRFANTWLGHLPVPFPKSYLLGIDIQQHDFEDYGRPSYLRGQWQDHGWWYYYLYAAAIKVPLGTWLLGLMSVATLLASKQKKPRIAFRDGVILLTPPLVIFAVCSVKNGFSEHFRYVLPCFPFVFIWIGCFAPIALKVNRKFLDRSRVYHYIAWAVGLCSRGLFAGTFALILFLWSVASSLWVYPHSLGYFNETVGGPLNGPEHLLGSNVDWGQDLLYLRDWVHENPNAEPVHLAFHGNFDPADVGFGKTPPWPHEIPLGKNTQQDKKFRFESGCCAVSINLLRGSRMAARGGAESADDSLGAALAELKNLEPATRKGYSIWIFH